MSFSSDEGQVGHNLEVLDPVVPRLVLSRGPDEVFRHAREKNTVYKTFAIKNRLRMAQQRPSVSLARLQYGDGEFETSVQSFQLYKETAAHSDPLPKLKEPVQLTRTLARTEVVPNSSGGSSSGKRPARRERDGGESLTGKGSDGEEEAITAETYDDVSWVAGLATLTSVDDDETDSIAPPAAAPESSTLSRNFFRLSSPGMYARTFVSGIPGQQHQQPHAGHAASSSNSQPFKNSHSSPKGHLGHAGCESSSCASSNNNSFSTAAGSSRHISVMARCTAQMQQPAAVAVISVSCTAKEHDLQERASRSGTCCATSEGVSVVIEALSSEPSTAAAAAAAAPSPGSATASRQVCLVLPSSKHGNGDGNGSSSSSPGILNRAVKFMGLRRSSQDPPPRSPHRVIREREDLGTSRAENMLKSLRAASFHDANGSTFSFTGPAFAVYGPGPGHDPMHILHQLPQCPPLPHNARRVTAPTAVLNGATVMSAAAAAAAPRLLTPRTSSPGMLGPVGAAGGCPNLVAAGAGLGDLGENAEGGSGGSAGRLPALRPGLSLAVPSASSPVSSTPSSAVSLSPASGPPMSSTSPGCSPQAAVCSPLGSAAGSGASATGTRFGSRISMDGRASLPASPTPSRLSRAPAAGAPGTAAGRGHTTPWKSFDASVSTGTVAATAAVGSSRGSGGGGSGAALGGWSSRVASSQRAVRAASISGACSPGPSNGVAAGYGAVAADLSSYATTSVVDLSSGGSGVLPKAASGGSGVSLERG